MHIRLTLYLRRDWTRIRNIFMYLHKTLYISGHCHEKNQISHHYDDVTMSGMASQITSLTIVYSAVYPGTDQRKHQSPAPMAFVWGIHRGPVNSPHKWPVTRKLFPFEDDIMGTNFVVTGCTHPRLPLWQPLSTMLASWKLSGSICWFWWLPCIPNNIVLANKTSEMRKYRGILEIELY